MCCNKTTTHLSSASNINFRCHRPRACLTAPPIVPTDRCRCRLAALCPLRSVLPPFDIVVAPQILCQRVNFCLKVSSSLPLPARLRQRLHKTDGSPPRGPGSRRKIACDASRVQVGVITMVRRGFFGSTADHHACCDDDTTKTGAALPMPSSSAST
eukprot:CAMPEP_0173387994 /NCGR_PEP_ID=MMETSP1356-20130122/10391_1 /TAXON_ID=77927 ORGANISM="Hemiselmis virescens, Strain PCC157" /NCGR_SAMPLE_ID=MMETSP1356 /ASSEMBLY_ACC=CAM_ASM_000847 /LENGTH=155 /DNA_ID=CAMNT_0014344775 /DNA_START=346 /DNA_END=813 /DNA_ORIENTATION=+